MPDPQRPSGDNEEPERPPADAGEAPNAETRDAEEAPGAGEAGPRGRGRTAGEQPPPADPEARKKELERKLAELQKDSGDLETQRGAAKKELAAVDKQLKAAQGVVKGYDRPLLAERKDRLDTYRATKRTMVEAAVEGHVDEIEQEVASVDAEIEAAKDELERKRAAQAEAEGEHQAALAAAEEARGELAGLAGFAAAAGVALGRAEALRREIETRDDIGDAAGMYFLLGELDATLNAVELPEAEVLRGRYHAAAAKLAAAEAEAATKAKASGEAAAAAGKASQELDELRAGRRQEILDRLAEIDLGAGEGEDEG